MESIPLKQQSDLEVWENARNRPLLNNGGEGGSLFIFLGLATFLQLTSQ